MERIRDQARALAETMPGYGAAELLWRGPQIATEGTDVVKDTDGNAVVRLVPRYDLPELSARLHLLANDAEHWLAWLKKKRGGHHLVAEEAFIRRLAAIYEAHEGDTGKPSRDPYSDSGEARDTPFHRFLAAAFNYVGERLPSPETQRRTLSDTPTKNDG